MKKILFPLLVIMLIGGKILAQGTDGPAVIQNEEKKQIEARAPQTTAAASGSVQIENDGIRAAGNGGLRLFDGIIGNYRYQFGDNGLFVNWGQNNLNSFNIGVNSAGDLEFMNAISAYGTGDTKVIFRDNGYVGIGELEPNTKLHIKDGDITIQDSYPFLFFRPLNNSDNAGLLFNNSSGSERGAMFYDHNSNKLKLRNNYFDVSVDNTGKLNVENGDLEVDGFSKLGGSSAPNIKMKKFSGTTNATIETSIVHGLTGSKILDISVFINGSNGFTYPPAGNGLSAVSSQYRLYYDSSNIYIGSVGSNLQGRPYRILVTYEE